MVSLRKIFEKGKNLDDYYKVCDMIKVDDALSDIFLYKEDRITNSAYAAIIEYDNKDVGFVSVLNEKGDYNFFTIDMGILKEYRSKGIGKEVLEIIKEIPCKDFIIGETRKSNIGANKTTSSVGILIAESDKYNYYLLQKERIEEFIEKDGLEKLANHYNSSKNKLKIKE